MLPNRLAVYFLIASGLAGALVPVIADFDTESVVGWIAGIGAITAAIGTWLRGWQKHEERIPLEFLEPELTEELRRRG